jgi:hypothetical protein
MLWDARSYQITERYEGGFFVEHREPSFPPQDRVLPKYGDKMYPHGYPTREVAEKALKDWIDYNNQQEEANRQLAKDVKRRETRKSIAIAIAVGVGILILAVTTPDFVDHLRSLSRIRGLVVAMLILLYFMFRRKT